VPYAGHAGQEESMPPRPRIRAGRAQLRRALSSQRSPSPAELVSSEHTLLALGILADLVPGSVVALHLDHHGRPILDGRDLPGDGRCGGAGLFTLVAPPGSLLVGVTFVGTPSTGDPTRIDVVVSAAGTVGAQVHRDGGVEEVAAPAGGVVVDALHRMLGLATPGPTPPLTDLVVGMWLHQVLTCCTGDRVPTWSDVAWAAVEPTTRVERGTSLRDSTELTRPTGCGGGIPPSEEAIAAEMVELADGASWDDLRRAAAIGRMRAPQLDPEEADWMDATMFARWMIESFPSPSAVTELLQSVGASDVADRIRSVLRRLERGTTRAA